MCFIYLLWRGYVNILRSHLKILGLIPCVSIVAKKKKNFSYQKLHASNVPETVISILKIQFPSTFISEQWNVLLFPFQTYGIKALESFGNFLKFEHPINGQDLNIHLIDSQIHVLNYCAIPSSYNCQWRYKKHKEHLCSPVF